MSNQESSVCSNCFSEIPLDGKFCQRCGRALAIICPICLESNESSARFCKNCGMEIGKVANHQEESSLHALQQTAPNDFQETAQMAMSQIEDERKPVTILFVDIVGASSKAEKIVTAQEWTQGIQIKLDLKLGTQASPLFGCGSLIRYCAVSNYPWR